MAYSVRMAIWQRICWTRVVRPRRCRLFLPGRMSQVFSKNPPLHRLIILIRLIVCQLFSFLTRTTCRRVSLALDGMSKAPCFAILGPSPGSKAKPITGCGTFRPTEQKVWYTGGWWGYVECGTCRAITWHVAMTVMWKWRLVTLLWPPAILAQGTGEFIFHPCSAQLRAPRFAILGLGSKAEPITGCAAFRPTEPKVWYTGGSGGWRGYVECGTFEIHTCNITS